MVVLVGAISTVGLALAVSGRYTTVAAIGLGGPLAALGIVALRHGLPMATPTRASQCGAALALVLAVAYGAFAAATPSENVVVTRDPASYVSTARWVAREGSLEADARGRAFAGVRGLRFSAAAVYDVGQPSPPLDVAGPPDEVRDSGRLEFQFNHLTALALALAFDVGGSGLMFRTPALLSALSLLVIYAVTVRLVRRPLLALVAPALLAASAPVLYVARDTYSESLTSVLLWGAVLVLIGIHRRPRVGPALVGGALLGAVVCARIDGLLYVGMLPPLVALSLACSGQRALTARARAWLATIGGAALVSAVGWFDLTHRSGSYVRDLGPQLSSLRAALVASVLLSALAFAGWALVTPVRSWAVRLRRPVAVVAAGATAVALLFGWLFRPEVQTATTDLILPTVQALQRRGGLPIDPDRSYAEDSLRWMAWYLGAPALAAAIGAITWATWRTFRRGTDAATLTLLVLCLGAGALYWYDPNITPDQLWATRRFVPATFPALAIWASAALAAFASVAGSVRLHRRHPVAAPVAMALAAGLLILPAAATTLPVRQHRIQSGFLRPVLDTCGLVGPDAAIVVLGGFGGTTLTQTLRSWCGVPVAGEGSALGPGKLPVLAAQVRANGYRLYLVSATRSGLDAYRAPGGPVPQSSSGAQDDFTAEQTLDRPPSHYARPSALLPVPVPFTLHVLEVASARPS